MDTSIHCTSCLALACLLLGACATSTVKETSTPVAAVAPAIQPSAAELEMEQYTAAIVYLEKGSLTLAEPALLEMIAKHPELAGPLANLGLLYVKQGNLDQAADALRHALDKNPSLAQAHHLLGYIECKRGHFSAAKEFYRKALEHKEDYAIAHYNLALLYDIYLRDIPNAIIHYTRYLQLVDYQDKRTADWLNGLVSANKKG